MSDHQETKRCPYCDEEIRVKAKICRFCNRDVSIANTPASDILNPETLVRESLKQKYQIIERIGRGGMAAVYKARQLNLNRIVAIKVVNQTLIQDIEFLKRFHQEARLSAALNHPNIVTIYEQEQEGAVHYIAMEYLEGIDLYSEIKRKGKLPIESSVNIIKEIAKALDYAHKNNIIHRDIKSSNIFLTRDGRIILTDFGIAQAISESRITQAGEVIGTPEYMSPEQAEGKKIKYQSDLYSLGAVFYECLTGRVPFREKNKMVTLYKLINEPPIPPENLNSSVPKWLNTILLRLLNKKPELRFKDGKQLILALNKKEAQFIKPTVSPGTTKFKKSKIPKPALEKEKIKKKSVEQEKKYTGMKVLLGFAILVVVVSLILLSGILPEAWLGSKFNQASIMNDTSNTNQINVSTTKPEIKESEKPNYIIPTDSFIRSNELSNEKPELNNEQIINSEKQTVKMNTTPYRPKSPYPGDNSILKSADVTLKWNCSDPDGDTLVYDIYLGTSRNFQQPKAHDEESKQFIINDPSLQISGKYFWKVIAKDNKGGQSESPVWSYVIRINRKPDKPQLISPTNGSESVATDIVLTWRGDDPDNDELKYHIYLKESNSKFKKIDETSMRQIVHNDLKIATNYTWKVIAEDNSGFTNESYVYSFTTRTTIIDPNGRDYKVIKVNDKTWMTENLSYQTINSWCYDGKSYNCNEYGRLYTWEDANNACPEGWHLPTRNEWNELQNKHTQLLLDPINARLGGHRKETGEYLQLDKACYYWTESYNQQKARCLIIFSDGRVKWDIISKKMGLSVRCIKN